jgi:hypothetical protein
MRGRPKAELVLTEEEHEQLTALTLRRKTAHPSSTPNGRFGCFPTADSIGINNLAALR